MPGRTLATLVAISVLAPILAYGDWVSDRMTPDAGGRTIRWRVQRVYLGRRHTNMNSCDGYRSDECIRWQGEPSERRHPSPREEHLIYYGKKILYRGTGESNTAVGPEWRDYLLRDGKVVDPVEIVQNVELGYPWVSSAPERSCEAYGERDPRDCLGVEPIDPVPPMKPPKPPFDLGCPPGATEPTVGTRDVGSTDGERLRALVEKETYRLLGHEQLDLVRQPTEPGDDGDVFLGQDVEPSAPGMYRHVERTVTCKLATHLQLLSQANFAGMISVSLCDRTSQLTWKVVCEARTRLTRTALELGFDPHERVTDFPWAPPHEQRLQGGLALEYFSALAIGHGVFTVPTAIVTDPDSRYAVVIQVESHH